MFLFIHDYAIRQRIFGGFLKLKSSKHPTDVDGIGTVLHSCMDSNIERPGRHPDGSGRRPDGSEQFQTAPGGF